MIFKHFIWEYGFQFQTFEKGIGQDGIFKSKSEFNYLFHNFTCNIVQRLDDDEDGIANLDAN